jgi:hypothetical protein
MNVKQSWSRHGEEVKASTASLIEIAFITFGVFSPWLIIAFTM